MQQFNIELDAPSTPLVLYAMQADSLSRFFQITITQGGTPWRPPAGAAWTVRFGATNMPDGWYDTITEVGGSTHPAVVVSDNVAVVEIAEQAVSVPGQNVLCVLVTDATGYQIASWQFQLLVTAVPGYDAPEATTYYNALTEQVAQTLANAQAAAASAVLSQSWAVGNTGTRDGENTNNAQYWSQQAAQSAQEAVGFRTMQGGAVLPIDGDIDLTQPYPTKTGGSLTVTSAANRIDSVTINGFTTQTGSGDPSPENIRPIENAGNLNKTVSINGTQNVSSVTALQGVYRINVQALVTDLASQSNQISTRFAYAFEYEQDSEHFYIHQPSGNLYIFVAQDKLSAATPEAAKQYFAESPLDIAYKSTENTGKFYTGIEVEQDGVYHCDIVELKDRLHSGDKLDTNIRSECDKSITFSETGVWRLAATGVFRISVPDMPGGGNAVTVLSDRYFQANSPVTNTITWPDKSIQAGASAGSLYVKDTAFGDDVSAFKQSLKTNLLKVWYKSVSGGTPKNIKREEHTRTTLVLDGVNNKFTKSETFWNLPRTVPKASLSPNVQCSFMPGSLFAVNPNLNFLFLTEENGVKYFDTVDECNTFLAQQYAAGTPCVIEYELAAPEVYADTPVEINNPQGTYTVSGESGTTCQVYMEPLQNGGVANAVENSLTLQDAEGETQLTYDGSAASALKLTKAIVGLSNVDNTPDAQKNVKGLAVEQTDVITGLHTGLYYYKANTPGAPSTVDGLLLALVYAPFGVQLAFPTNSGFFYRWAVDNWSNWVRLDKK